MAIEKFGASEKILKTAQDLKALESLRATIAAENTLVRCETCQHLIAKKSSNGYVDIQHRREVIVVKTPAELTVQCPKCSAVVKII